MQNYEEANEHLVKTITKLPADKPIGPKWIGLILIYLGV